MKKILLTAFKFILVLSLLLLICLLTFGLVIWMHWPWWVGLFFLIGYCGLFLSWLFIRKVVLRRREQNFINQVVEQDNAVIRGQEGDQEGMQELKNRWQEAVETLKASHLNKQGNPLYVLPWYMVIGESRSGKSTAIQSAGMSAPFAEINRTGGIAGTRNCEWWFFEQAVILDTAGRYTIPLEEGRDKEEWQQFLSLLVKYRKKEPLNGLVVTMAADKLLQADLETIADDGRNIRQRIDELMRVLGKLFPVYVLITKCDLIQGMTGFCERLPEKSLEQAMGLLNQENNKDINTLLHDVSRSIGDRLQKLRLLLLHAKQTPGQTQPPPPADLLLFPNEFKNLHNRLSTFIETTFKENPYQETPILRGLYFSSGRQEGTPYSHFLHALGLIKQQEVLPGTNRGLFLHDLFARILPGDRFLFAPTQRALAWDRLTRNIGLAAWVAIILALCGLLSFSFVKNLATLRTNTDSFKITLQGDLLVDTSVTERFQTAISNMENDNNSWWLPRLGLHESKDVELRIKQKFCRLFNNDLSKGLNAQIDTFISEFSPTTNDNLTGSVVAHLARRINLIQARLDHENMAGLSEMNQPSFQPLFTGKEVRSATILDDRLVRQYHYYLHWQKDKNILLQEKQRLQRYLHHILNLPETSLNWLATWTNNYSGLKRLDLPDFWKAPVTLENAATIPPAFTIKGRKFIDALIKDIETAIPDPHVIATKKIRFHKWYNQAYEQVWYDFAAEFPQAEYYLTDNTAWQQTAVTMATDKSPYFSLLQTMARELSTLDEQEEKKDWIQLIKQIELLRKEAEHEAAIKESKSMLAKATKKGKEAIRTIEKKTGLDSSRLLTNQIVATGLFYNYREALKDVTLVTSSRTVSYAMAAEVFKDDPTTSKSSLHLANRHFLELRRELSSYSQEQKVVWRLLAGPLYFLRDYVYLEAACHLNNLWEKNVLVEIKDIQDKNKLKDELFLEDGYAIRFIKGPAGPFLDRSVERGFYPKTAIDRMIPFENTFLIFLNDSLRLAKFTPDVKPDADLPFPTQPGANAISNTRARKEKNFIPLPPTIKSSYSVQVTANPTSVNREAKILPHATTLELICESGTTRLINYNYPKQKKFFWEPEYCQQVNLHIDIGRLVLTKKYEDKLSFAQFAKEFQNGYHHFTPKDFPEKKSQMARMQLKNIKVQFQIEEGQALVDLLDQAKKRATLPEVPHNITTCWDK